MLFGRSKVLLNVLQREQLANMIFSTNQTQRVVIPNLIPKLYNLPLSGSIEIPNSPSNNLDIVLALNRSISTETVVNSQGIDEEIQLLLPFWFVSNKNYTQHYVDDDDTSIHASPQLILVSAEVPSILGGSLAASGIIGLCKFIKKNTILFVKRVFNEKYNYRYHYCFYCW